MGNRSKYKTKQREILLDYFSQMPGKHITAADICQYFKENGLSIGQSTIYRNLEQLVDEGILTKYTIDANTPACFEYTGSDSPAPAEISYHCKCEKCGKLIHLHCEEIEALQEHFYKDHHFKLNPKRTVFYGLCDQCLYTCANK